MVVGGDSSSDGRGFESHHHILDGYFFTLICCKMCNKRKRGRGILWRIISPIFGHLEKSEFTQWREKFAMVGSKCSKLTLKTLPKIFKFYQSSEISPNLVTEPGMSHFQKNLSAWQSSSSNLTHPLLPKSVAL